MSVLPKIVWPIPSNNRGSEFKNQEEILSHIGGESTGQYMIGRSGMWHGGIHITEATTPWCALSGKSPLEALDFPVPFKGEQAVRCMADGEVVAYRVCKDYLTLAWESGPLSFSGSFVLVKHFIQPGRKNPAGCISIPCICTLPPIQPIVSIRRKQSGQSRIRLLPTIQNGS